MSRDSNLNIIIVYGWMHGAAWLLFAVGLLVALSCTPEASRCQQIHLKDQRRIADTITVSPTSVLAQGRSYLGFRPRPLPLRTGLFPRRAFFHCLRALQATMPPMEITNSVK